ncbi:MAG: sulfatase family protein, partial [Sphingobacterium sp.]
MMSNKTVLLISLVFCFQISFSQPQPVTPPNIVLIIADDIGAEDVGYVGNPDVRTPNIDALASSGLVFNNMYVTTSSCSPSRCSIITGRYP